MNNGYSISTKNYSEAIETSTDFYLQFKSFNFDAEAMVIKILHRLLEKFDIQYIRETVVNVVKELVNNAVKANVKRIYFQLNELDINKAEDYRSGMETFKEETYRPDDTSYLDKLITADLFVRILFGIGNTHLRISIINNTPILDVEIDKIQARIKKAFKYTDITEAFEDVLDDSEGAGLGLIMTMMMMRNSGLSQDTLQVDRRDNLTVATLSIPLSLTNSESQNRIADEIVKEIDEIPTIPDNIKNIQRMCSDPDMSIKEISDVISHDPGLTASILKLANSAGYMTGRKIETLTDAIKIIGIKGINTLIIATGVLKAVDARYKKFEKMWKESYKRAFYAQKIATIVKMSKIGDFSYLAGLLADIGYMIILSLKPELMKRLQEIAGIKGLDSSLAMEEISLGTSHSSLGAMICAKWRFNEALTSAIEYHHRPYMAPEKYRILVYIVYLATCFIDFESGKMRYEVIPDDVLKSLKIADRHAFKTLHGTVKSLYEDQMKSLL